MSNLYGICKYAIEGENARKVFDAVSNSYRYRTYPDLIKMDYSEGLLLIEEEWEHYPQFGHYVLPFLIGEDFYWMDYSPYSGECTTNDEEGKYFTAPSEQI